MKLTNEKLLTGRFKNQFELVNYAIKLAENMIKSGRDTRVKTDINNRAYQILQEIAAGVDRFDDVVVSQSAASLDVPKAVHVYESSGRTKEPRQDVADVDE